MDYCPNCSAQLEEGALECHNCGAQFQSQSQTGGEPGQPQQGTQQQGRQANQQPHQTQQPPGQAPPPEQGQRQQNTIGPLTRRQALAAGGGVAVIAGAWLLGFGDSSSDSPESVVRNYLDAVEARDADAASNFVHQNSPAQDELITPLSGGGEVSTDEYSITVDETEIVDRESEGTQGGVQEFATVETTFTTSIETDESSQSDTTTVQFRLARNSAGTWKLWSVSTSSTTVDDSRPAVNFEFDYASGSSGPGDGVLTITHTAGDSLEASTLFVRGDGVNTVGNGPRIDFSRRFDRLSSDRSPNSTISAGTEVQLEATSNYEVSVVWESQQSGNAAILAEDSGPDA